MGWQQSPASASIYSPGALATTPSWARQREPLKQKLFATQVSAAKMHTTKNADPRTPGQAGLFPPADAAEELKSKPGHDQEAFPSDADNASLEEKNEREVQQHPQEVTASAELGVQKAEAAALVWTKKTVYCTYAW